MNFFTKFGETFFKTINYYCLHTIGSTFQQSSSLSAKVGVLPKSFKNLFVSSQSIAVSRVGDTNTTLAVNLLMCVVKGYSGVMFNSSQKSSALIAPVNDKFFLLSEYMQVYTVGNNYSFNKLNNYLNNSVISIFYKNAKTFMSVFYVITLIFLGTYFSIIFLSLNAEFFIHPVNLILGLFISFFSVNLVLGGTNTNLDLMNYTRALALSNYNNIQVNSGNLSTNKSSFNKVENKYFMDKKFGA
jgi:hypothetical protein